MTLAIHITMGMALVKWNKLGISVEGVFAIVKKAFKQLRFSFKSGHYHVITKHLKEDFSSVSVALVTKHVVNSCKRKLKRVLLY